LAGIIASFVAQGVELFKSAIAGVNIHGLAGDAVSERYSMMGNTPSLMLDELPKVLKKFE
jgi:NAD(P)H-hydrate epimerase